MLTRSRIALLVVVLCAGRIEGSAFAAEEKIRTPSDQMKEAVNKLGKAPATIGNSLQNLTDAAKEKLREAFGGNANSETKPAPVDLNVPKKNPQLPAPAAVLNGSDRDPFRPMTLRTKVDSKGKRENLSPLERFELSQLKLVGIVWDTKDPRAMVEDTAALGYVVKVGTPIGNSDGKVKAIHRNEVVVEEFYSDEYGARKKREVPMKLSTE
jgi:type IV pilus assembly protein PilP